MSTANPLPNRRIGYYLQSYSYPGTGRPLPLVALGEPNLHTSHVVLGTFHLNYKRDDGAGLKKLYLNEELYDEGDNVRIWEEAKQLQAKGIKILTCLGPDMWDNDHFGYEDNFAKAYEITKEMITAKAPDGVDLNVEPHDDPQIRNEGVSRVIKQLKADFPDLLITMAPGGRELLVEPPVGGGLSDVNYQSLYEELGEDIAWFHVQCYNTWGSLADADDFSRYVDAKFPPEKLVLMVPGHPDSAPAGGWLSGEELKVGLEDVMKKYPHMGGIAVWEWYNATLTNDPPTNDPLIWSNYVSRVVFSEN